MTAEQVSDHLLFQLRVNKVPSPGSKHCKRGYRHIFGDHPGDDDVDDDVGDDVDDDGDDVLLVMKPDKASGRGKAAFSQGTANLQSTATMIMITMIDDDCGNNATMIMIMLAMLAC